MPSSTRIPLVRNLANYALPEEKLLNAIQTLYDNATDENNYKDEKDEAKRARNKTYQLTMPLLAISLIADEKRPGTKEMYQSISKQAKQELVRFEKQIPDWAAGMWGRVLFVDYIQSDQKSQTTADETATHLRDLLPNSPSTNPFFAQGKSWLALFDASVYTSARLYPQTDEIKAKHDRYIESFLDTFTAVRQIGSNPPGDTKEDKYSYRRWAEIMALQAPAAAHDEDHYLAIIRQMATPNPSPAAMAEKSNTSAEKSSSLEETKALKMQALAAVSGIPANYTPHWAKGFLYKAAADLPDHDLYNGEEVEKLIKESQALLERSQTAVLQSRNNMQSGITQNH